MSDQDRHKRERPHSIDQIGGELRAAMANGETAQPGRRRRAFTIAAAAAVAACALAAIALISGGDDKPFTVESAVAAVTRAAFDTPREHPDEYLYTTSTETFIGGRSVQTNKRRSWQIRVTAQRETWIRPQRTAWTRTQFTEHAYPTERDRRSAEAARRDVERDWKRRNHGKAVPPGMTDFMAESTPASPIVCRVSADYAWLVGDRKLSELLGSRSGAVPSDPRKLYAFLERRLQNNALAIRKDTLIWMMIDSASRLSTGSITPKQRSALIGTLALIPGTETYGETTDPTGRAAIGFSRTSGGKRYRLYFDRETGLTSYSDVATTSGKPDAGVSTWRLDRFEYVKQPPPLTPSKGKSLSFLLVCPYDGPNGHYLRRRAAD